MIVLQTVKDVRFFGWQQFWKEPLEFVLTIGVFFVVFNFIEKDGDTQKPARSI